MTPGGPVAQELVAFLGALDPGGVEAVALVGSGAAGGLRPDSDLDLLVLSPAARSTTRSGGRVRDNGQAAHRKDSAK